MVKYAAMKRLKSLSVVFPCYNDSKTISDLIRTADRVGRSVADKLEIIVVNDGSTDNSPQVLADIQKKIPVLMVISHAKNMGYGATIWHGLKSAGNDYVFYTDGDGQYDPAELVKLVEKLGPNTMLVNGYKTNRQDALYRIMIGKLYNFFVKTVFNIKLKDVDCDFRLFRKDALDKLDIKEHGGTMCLEMVKKIEKLGGEILEVPVSHYPRKYGKSQFFKIRNLLRVFVDIPKLFLMLGR